MNLGEITLCTLFDENYLLSGVTMISSVEKYASVSVNWTILALTDEAERILNKIREPNWQILNLKTLRDPEFFALRETRPWKEFCFTAGACLLKQVEVRSQPGSIIAYIDSDCFFYDDIVQCLKPLTQGASILIHEHKFSPDRIQWLAKSGRFNVGVVAGVTATEFSKCLTRWRSQVIDNCEVNPDLGKCGDQSYLNEWPDLYPSLEIMKGKGMGLGPWNLTNYSTSKINRQIKVDNDCLYFYHFHGLTIYGEKIPFLVAIPEPSYKLNYSDVTLIYKPYIQGINKVSRKYNWALKSLHAKLPFKNMIKILFKREKAVFVFKY